MKNAMILDSESFSISWVRIAFYSFIIYIISIISTLPSGIRVCDATSSTETTTILMWYERPKNLTEKPTTKRVPTYIFSPDVVIPAIDNHSMTIIFLHGVEDIELTEFQYEIMKIRDYYMKIVAPSAYKIPVLWTMKRRFVCYDYELDDNDEVKNSTEHIHSLIEVELKRKKIKPERIILSGFGQGGAMAIHAALTFRLKLGGVVALSTWVPPHRAFTQSVVFGQKIPILQIHGMKDKMLIERASQITSMTYNITTSGLVEYKTYPELGHNITDDVLNDMRDFIDRHVVEKTEP